MPLYTYKCGNCEKEQDRFFRISEKPDTVPCECGAEARKILSASTVHGDEMPAWMRHPEVRGCLQNPYEKPIQSRSEYKRYLKDNGIAEHSANREI